MKNSSSQKKTSIAGIFSETAGIERMALTHEPPALNMTHSGIDCEVSSHLCLIHCKCSGNLETAHNKVHIQLIGFIPLPDDKILDCSILRQTADDIL